MTPGAGSGAGPAARETWRAPAKINLWLAVTGRRPGGYHEVDTAYQAIDLADAVTLDAGEGLSCGVEGDWAAGVPTGGDNLAVRAARLLAELAGREPGLAVKIVKRVPPGAGLGGGSSDAAAVLAALGARFGVPGPELATLAARLGADVPFFLTGGTRRARGIGEILEPLEPPAERWGILLYPGVSVDTAWAYRAWDEANTKPARATPDATRTPAGKLPDDWRRLGNALEEIVQARHPEVALAAAILGGGPAALVRMTGSGSAVFALYDDPAARVEDVARVQRDARTLPGAVTWSFTFADHGVAPDDGVTPPGGRIFHASRESGG